MPLGPPVTVTASIRLGDGPVDVLGRGVAGSASGACAVPLPNRSPQVGYIWSLRLTATPATAKASSTQTSSAADRAGQRHQPRPRPHPQPVPTGAATARTTTRSRVPTPVRLTGRRPRAGPP